MQDSSSNKNVSFRKDFLWYLLGSLIPMIIGFVKTPIFTRHFDEAAFGQLGLVSITFSFLGMILFSWLNSCLWRFYHKYKELRNLDMLYANLLFIFGLAILLSLLFTVIWAFVEKDDIVQELIFFSFIQMIVAQLFMAYMVIVRLAGESRFYTIFQGIKSLIGLVLALLFVFYFDQNIVALVSSLALTDILALVVLSGLNPAAVKIRFEGVDKPLMKRLISYGSAGLLLNLSLLSVSFSDRYIIALYYDMKEVGIYDQVTKIAQISIMALVTVYFNAINPGLFRRLEENFDRSLQVMANYMYPFLLIGIPVVFYASLFAEELAWLLLGANFRSGFVIMPFIFIATFVHGFSNFFELRLKFSDKLKLMGGIAISTALLNIVLNLFLVKHLGYHWAAHTTLFSYLFMLLLLYLADKSLLKSLKNKRLEFLKLTVVLGCQYVLYILVIRQFNLDAMARLGIGMLFLLLYFLIFRKSIVHIRIPTN